MLEYKNRKTGFMYTVRVLRRWSSTSSRSPACWVMAKNTISQAP